MHGATWGSVVAALGLALLAGCTSDSPEPSPAPRTTDATSKAAPDFDGDGRADLVVGIGEAPSRVTVQYGSGATQDIRRADLDDVESATFGRSLLARDLDGDSHTDLVVSDPTPGGTAAHRLPGTQTSSAWLA